ncbi:MAG: inosine/xanthosine triphosphatase [Clostridia bacterium]
MKLAIATKSLDKIEGIKKAFSRFFVLNESEIKIYATPIESGVSEQPFGDETYQGAQNRTNNIIEKFPNMDYYISCEAGIDVNFGKYFNVQVVCIYDFKSKTYLWGKSAGWMIPSKDVDEIKRENLDIYLREKGINSIDELLGPNNARSVAIAHATELALCSKRLR